MQKIILLEDGPILFRGPVQYDGIRIDQEQVALCRCGKSETQPFCNGAHKAADYKAPGLIMESLAKCSCKDAEGCCQADGGD